MDKVAMCNLFFRKFNHVKYFILKRYYYCRKSLIILRSTLISMLKIDMDGPKKLNCIKAVLAEIGHIGKWFAAVLGKDSVRMSK